MVGLWSSATMKKPSRSDEVLDEERQREIAGQVRAQFDSLSPRRPLKPNRSEPDSSPMRYSSSPSDEDADQIQIIPELDKFRSLRSQSLSQQGPFSDEGITSGVMSVQDEFVETQYYKELISVDKQHHMTGSGFIRVVRDGSDEDGQLATGYANGGSVAYRIHGVRSNPATNDWVPCTEHVQSYVSSKPKRSESS